MNSHRHIGVNPRPRRICIYYQQGHCVYGSRCRFIHPLSSSTPQAFVPRAEASVFTPRKMTVAEAEATLCPKGSSTCPKGRFCSLVHGDTCPTCNKQALHPTHADQRRSHTTSCAWEAVLAASRTKACGICMEVIFEKRDARFGILSGCSHCFCLPCLRTWRGSKHTFEQDILRACPECRVRSDFVCPSRVWVDSASEREALFGKYKAALRRKECMYYRQGTGECPFGNKCFYGHNSPDGESVDVGPPPRRRRNSSQRINLQRFIFDSLRTDDFRELMGLLDNADFPSDEEGFDLLEEETVVGYDEL